MSFLTDDLDMEDYLTYEGVDFRHTHGSHGVQLNLRECPTCGDDRWKVYMNAETGFGNCFKCDAAYTKWSYVGAHLETADKRVIAQHVSDTLKMFGYQPKRKFAEPVAVEQGTLKLPSGMNLPTTDGRNAQYLEERGVSGEYAAYFDLRYSFVGTYSYKTDEGKMMTQNFGDRIIIPIRDLDGKIVTFQGRDVTGDSDTKYLFPAKLPGTARFLYNGHKALGVRAREVLVGEGAFDVIAQKIAIDQFDEMKHIIPVGTFGKHLSETSSGPSQLDAFRRLKRECGLETVTIMWDGEEEALKSALRAAGKLTGIGLKTRVSFLPKGCDPAEVAPECVRDAWKNAQPYSRLLETRLTLKNPYS